MTPIACLKALQAERREIYPRIDRFAARLCAFLNNQAVRCGVPVRARQAGAALQIFVAKDRIETLRDMAKVDKDRTLVFTGALLRQGVMTLPRGLCYLSSVHSLADIEEAMEAVSQSTAASGGLDRRALGRISKPSQDCTILKWLQYSR